MSRPSGPTVIVVGAGIVGAACAEALAEAGCQVTVLEGGLAGAGATAASMGHLVVMDDSEAQLALSAWSRRRWTERAFGCRELRTIMILVRTLQYCDLNHTDFSHNNE